MARRFFVDTTYYGIDVEVEVFGSYEGPDPSVGLHRGNFDVHKVLLEGQSIQLTSSEEERMVNELVDRCESDYED